MIGTALSRQQMERLLRQLAELEQPWNCPHGRSFFRRSPLLLAFWTSKGARAFPVTVVVLFFIQLRRPTGPTLRHLAHLPSIERAAPPLDLTAPSPPRSKRRRTASLEPATAAAARGDGEADDDDDDDDDDAQDDA